MVNVEGGEDRNPKKHDGDNDSNKRKKTNVSLAAVILAATLAASTTVVVIDAFVVPRQSIPFTNYHVNNS